mmetsp:Transcript_51594/g.109726  ORF Transcript_51594/g.109726 Transcript_51594/m.109726 type:complete len:270 (+) Transcript_51594:169-978(+)
MRATDLGRNIRDCAFLLLLNHDISSETCLISSFVPYYSAKPHHAQHVMRQNITACMLLMIILLFDYFASTAAAIPSPQPQPRSLTHPNYDARRDIGAISHRAGRNPTLIETAKHVSFLPVVYVSILNSVINILRPDPAIIWQARVPRILWELCIAFVAKSANQNQPSVCLLLCLMMVPTALMDIFVWAPSFAMFADFETCSGGGFLSRQPKVCTSDYVTGIGRLFVTAQSLFTGVFYLFTAVVSWITFAESRDLSVANKNALAMANAMR